MADNLICHLCHEPGHAKYNCPNNCHYCKGKGHTKFNCPNRPKGSQPPPHPRARIAITDEPNYQQPIYTLNQEEYDQFQQLISSKIGPQANSAQSGTFPSPNPSWVADSGATHHMTGKKGILSNLHYISHPPVRVANGSSCPVRGIGSVSHSKPLKMSSVLYVPGFPDNLCSISQLTKQNNCSAHFYPEYCFSKKLKTRPNPKKTTAQHPCNSNPFKP